MIARKKRNVMNVIDAMGAAWFTVRGGGFYRFDMKFRYG